GLNLSFFLASPLRIFPRGRSCGREGMILCGVPRQRGGPRRERDRFLFARSANRLSILPCGSLLASTRRSLTGSTVVLLHSYGGFFRLGWRFSGGLPWRFSGR